MSLTILLLLLGLISFTIGLECACMIVIDKIDKTAEFESVVKCQTGPRCQINDKNVECTTFKGTAIKHETKLEQKGTYDIEISECMVECRDEYRTEDITSKNGDKFTISGTVRCCSKDRCNDHTTTTTLPSTTSTAKPIVSTSTVSSTASTPTTTTTETNNLSPDSSPPPVTDTPCSNSTPSCPNGEECEGGDNNVPAWKAAFAVMFCLVLILIGLVAAGFFWKRSGRKLPLPVWLSTKGKQMQRKDSLVAVVNLDKVVEQSNREKSRKKPKEPKPVLRDVVNHYVQQIKLAQGVMGDLGQAPGEGKAGGSREEVKGKAKAGGSLEEGKWKDGGSLEEVKAKAERIRQEGRAGALRGDGKGKAEGIGKEGKTKAVVHFEEEAKESKPISDFFALMKPQFLEKSSEPEPNVVRVSNNKWE